MNADHGSLHVLVKLYVSCFPFIFIFHVFVSRNDSDEGDDPEKKKLENQLTGLHYFQMAFIMLNTAAFILFKKISVHFFTFLFLSFGNHAVAI